MTESTAIVESHPLSRGAPPEWASGWGQDEWGPFADLCIADVWQRLRWIPPGRFLMGSPADEPGRFDAESLPKHVAVERGFWLFDTPVTQALWQAITGENPSRFQSPTRPVEQVSWNDATQFMAELSQRMSQLLFEFPTESEWEYACRAGTTFATYAGPVEYLGDANAPALGPIAWYGGNCGVEFDLDKGVEVSWLKDRQYEFKSGGTNAVGLKFPNAWGLYDMLGNVWEWCADWWEPHARDKASAGRVIRGGSWYGSARLVRAACRFRVAPVVRNGDLGFRCRVQERALSS